MSEENKVEGVEAPAAEPSKLETLKAASAAANEGKQANEREAKEVKSKEEKALAVKAAAESVGIKNIVEVIAFGAAVAKALAEAKKNDGKIDFADIGQLFPVVPLLAPMIDGIGEVPKELGDLDEVELEALMAEVSKVLGSESNAKLVMQIKAGLKFAHAAYELFKSF